MAMYAKIRRMHFREHLTISEIRRRTSLSRNTIKKWLKGSEEPHPQRRHRHGKLTPFEPRLKLIMETDAHRPRRDRRTAKRLFEMLRQEGYTGGYSQRTDFIRRTRQHATSTGKSAFVPLKFQLGEAFQFDWSEEWLVIGGIHRKILAAHTKLSRAWRSPWGTVRAAGAGAGWCICAVYKVRRPHPAHSVPGSGPLDRGQDNRRRRRASLRSSAASCIGAIAGHSHATSAGIPGNSC